MTKKWTIFVPAAVINVPSNTRGKNKRAENVAKLVTTNNDDVIVYEEREYILPRERE